MSVVEEAKTLLATEYIYDHYSSGKVMRMIPYIGNKVEGIEHTYRQDGTLKDEYTWKDNKMVYRRSYYSDGSFLSETEL